MAKVRRTINRKGSTDEEETLSDISLPTEPNTPPDSLNDVVITIFGRKNIGKSSLASQFPGALTCMFEEGRFNLNIMQIPKRGEPDLDWDRFRRYRDKIVESNDFIRPVIDTVEKAYDLCFRYVCDKFNVAHPSASTVPYQIWDAIKREFQDVLSSFRNAGRPPIYISHEKAKPLVTKVKGLARDGLSEEESVKLVRIEPSCTGQAQTVIEETCDYVFYYGFTEGYRTITVRSPFDTVWVSCGMSGTTFLDPDGALLQTFQVGNSPEEAYKTLENAFHNNGVRDIDYVPVATNRELLPSRNRRKNG
jgi:hypothetical protein